MNNFNKVLLTLFPMLLIVGGFIGMALSLAGAGWAVLFGLLLYPTFSSTSSGGNNDSTK